MPFHGGGSAIAFLIVSMGTGLFTFSISTGVNFGKLYLSKKLFISLIWIFRFICLEAFKVNSYFFLLRERAKYVVILIERMGMGLWESWPVLLSPPWRGEVCWL